MRAAHLREWVVVLAEELEGQVVVDHHQHCKRRERNGFVQKRSWMKDGKNGRERSGIDGEGAKLGLGIWWNLGLSVNRLIWGVLTVN